MIVAKVPLGGGSMVVQKCKLSRGNQINSVEREMGTWKP